MRKTKAVTALTLLGLLALGRCTVRPQVSNTGFVGTWARDGMVKTFRSQISIFRDGERYRFRWKLDSTDGKWQVRCDWDGRCQETTEGKRSADYSFDVRETPEGSLRVECTRIPLETEGKGYHYIDLLELDSAGTSLSSYTIEMDGRTYPKESTPRKILTKLSDTVSDPPRASS